jgi:hypothetical protein
MKDQVKKYKPHYSTEPVMNLKLIALISVIVLNSCATDSPLVPDSSATVIPGVGSWYVFSENEVGLDGKSIPNTGTESEYRVLATNISYAGRSHAWSIGRAADSARPTMFYCTDANDDIWYAGLKERNQTWIRFPLSTGLPYEVIYSDTSNNSGREEVTTWKVTVVRDGYELLEIGADSLSTVRFTVRTGGLSPRAGSGTATWWFAPALGVFVRKFYPAALVGWPDKIDEGALEVLKSYQLF